jgi:hypothetical protein
MRADPFYSPNLSFNTTYQPAFAPRRRPTWDDPTARAPRVMMLSIVHAQGHGVAVVLGLQARALAARGFSVIVAGPASPHDVAYTGCDRVTCMTHKRQLWWPRSVV